MTPVTVEYICACTNRHPHAADVSSKSLMAFGSSKLVALWNAQNQHDQGVSETLPGHEGHITCVRFVNDDIFVSGDDKGTLKIWKNENSQWKAVYTARAHEKSISAAAVHGALLVTGASDSVVKVWKITLNAQAVTLCEEQSIRLKKRYPLALAVSTLPGTDAAVLAIGSTDRDVQVWVRSEDQFVSSAILSGHEDWVKSLAFRQPESSSDLLILASGSQDATIRLWNVEPHSKKQTEGPKFSGNDLSDELLLDAFEASLGELADAEEGGRQISLKRHVVTIKGPNGPHRFSITFDALLIGHEAGVTSLSWRPPTSDTKTPTLLSTSTDSSLILWSPSTIITPSADGSTSIWINRQRFGDLGGQRLGGFVGGLWCRRGVEAAAWGWNGGWRRWRCSEDNQLADGHDENWAEVEAITGHSAAVRGLAWSPEGEYLISAGLDQTTRIHGELAVPHSHEDSVRVWHELARPQVHGYDLVGVAFVNSLRFISIADEKVARVFEAPREFVETLNYLGTTHFEINKTDRPRAATVPPLGLSNKAVAEVDFRTDNPNQWYDADRLKRRPFEGELAAITLWPEVEKVFGHGYESISLSVSNSRKYAATACKATSPDHAVVRVYDTEEWKLVGSPLAGHQLTVTQIAFSPDDRFILSVSRDRTWRLYERDNDNGFVPIAADKSHARIIWDCAWAPEGDMFATASRDKTVKVWRPKEADNWKKCVAAMTIKTPEAATAVAVSPLQADGRRRVAIGLETGEILVYSSPGEDDENWRLDLTIASRQAHADQIHRLIWRPYKRSALQLASCSEDGTLKVLTVQIATG